MSSERIKRVFEYSRKLHDSGGPLVIRVLELLPSISPSEIIRCRLKYATLNDDSLTYEAISYCWGGQLPTEAILCDDAEMLITRNLAQALFTFRSTNQPVNMWADAICINQNDAEEKNQQVPLMRQIYQRAESVRIWLGVADDKRSANACKLLRQIDGVVTVLEQEGLDPTQMGADDILSYDMPALTDSAWKSLAQLLNNSWFQRSWIIQELSVAREAIIYYGNQKLPWELFASAVQLIVYGGLIGRIGVLYKLSESSTTKEVAAPPISQLIMLRQSLQRCPAGLDFFTLLNFARNFKAHDPRDKIYSLLGIAAAFQKSPKSIVPDYRDSKMPSEVYTEYAVAALENYDTLDILSVSACLTSTDSAAPDLPSWVPDWSTPLLISELLDHNLEDSSEYIYNFDATNTSRIPKQYFISGKVLQLRGWVFDEVIAIGETLDPRQTSIPYKNHRAYRSHLVSAYLTSLFANWKNVATHNMREDYPVGGISTQDAFVYTLFPGTNLSHYPKDSLDISSMRAVEEILNSSDFIERWLNKMGLKNKYAVAAFRFLFQSGKRIEMQDFDIKLFQEFRFLGIVFFSNRRMIRTSQGYIGLGPGRVRKGDKVMLCCGGKMPLIMRQHPKSRNSWMHIGDAYIHGIMNGEVFDEARCVDIFVE